MIWHTTNPTPSGSDHDLSSALPGLSHVIALTGNICVTYCISVNKRKLASASAAAVSQKL